MIKSILLLCSIVISLMAAPNLIPGTWLNISPSRPGINPASNIFCQGMAIDPNNPSTLYLCVCGFEVSKPVGIYKTTDGGSTWKRIGKMLDHVWAGDTIDEPVHLAIDPKNSNHIYCVDGVRGTSLGFWISNDGGNTFTKPEGFVNASKTPVGTEDLYSIATEPGDFNHILVSYHSPWAGSTNCGVMESKDGGLSWRVVNPPAGSAGGYGMSIFFLYFPDHNTGNKNTWLFTAQQGGFFRTTDAGATWTQCYDKQMTHGGNQIYCAKNGVLYSGGYQYLARSTDNGASWKQVTAGMDYSWYIGVCGDGNYLYTGNSGTNRPFFTSPESDGLTWTAYQGGAQTFSSDPFEMHFDSVNRIMYSANWEGLFALKVLGSAVENKLGGTKLSAGNPATRTHMTINIRNRSKNFTAAKDNVFDVRGRKMRTQINSSQAIINQTK